jgi:hypothetical protein
LDSYQLYIVPSYSTASQSPSRNSYPPLHSLKNSISPLSLSPTHKNRTSPVCIPSFRSLSLSDTSTPISTSSSPTRTTVSPRSHSPISSTTSPFSIALPSHPPSLTSALGVCSRRDPALFPRYPSPVVMRRNSFSPPDHHSYSTSSASSHFLSRSPSSELSFVGSFEESILSGRMSHTPATQFRGFVADLGVCCKNFAPSHIRIPFDAVCYRLMETSPLPRGGFGNGGGNSEEEIGAGMSLIPYVGSIDLEDKKYRIPPSGIIQLTIFNPSKTPIKTFLIKYDVHDMPPLTKTFIRQRICSTAPTPSPSPSPPSPSHSTLPTSAFLLSSPSSSSTSRSSSSVSLADSTGVPLMTTSPPKLQYAVHLRIKSPRKKKFYLYRNIRVVFPHRVPDESCNLKTYYDLPDQPRYYPYSPEELQS